MTHFSVSTNNVKNYKCSSKNISSLKKERIKSLPGYPFQMELVLSSYEFNFSNYHFVEKYFSKGLYIMK